MKEQSVRAKLAAPWRALAVGVVAGAMMHVGALPCSAQLPAGFQRVTVVTGVTPTTFAFAPDGRIFVAQKGGRIRIVDASGNLKPGSYASIPISSGGLQGLLGLALDPNFPATPGGPGDPYVYIYYITGPGSLNYSGTPTPRLSRLTGSEDKATPNSEKIILEFPTGNAGHNAGGLHFGPDGMLYLGIGDGGTKSNPPKLNILRGKIIRIKPNTANINSNTPPFYSIPSDNPFAGSSNPNIKKEIWLRGLRQPWSFTWRPGTNALIVGDVGHATWEELDFGVPGGIYGYDTHGWEGPCPRIAPECSAPPAGSGPPASYPDSLEWPIWYYHSPVVSTTTPDAPDPTGTGKGGGEVAIIGGQFISEGGYPAAYQGKYIFADFVQGWVHLLTFNSENKVVAGSEELFDQFPLPKAIACIVRGPDGKIYVGDRAGSTIYKYVFTAP